MEAPGLNDVRQLGVGDMQAHTSGESDVDRTQDLLTVIIAQLDELLQFKREMQEAMEGIQTSGMMGMIGKLFQR